MGVEEVWPVPHVETNENPGKQNQRSLVDDLDEFRLGVGVKEEDGTELHQLQEDEDDAGDHPHVQAGDVGDPGHGPPLTGEHGGQGQQDCHGDGESLGDTVGGQEEGQPGDGEEDRGDHVGLDEVILELPPEHQLQNETWIVDIVVLSVVGILARQLLVT